MSSVICSRFAWVSRGWRHVASVTQRKHYLLWPRGHFSDRQGWRHDTEIHQVPVEVVLAS
jgi:hypothetical protein